ncbi:MAG: glycerophosphodiester phosphodiesterase family protein [Candidatus Didemnitutus sp.]|nr:glycerophosphodiester phosphodiesterase family protein [Candidatus Didemnitutus sp.]
MLGLFALVGANLPGHENRETREMLVIAHRGFSSMAPENTLPAFELALDAGAGLVELDYHASADGVPIVIHDHSLRRTTNAEQVFGAGDWLVTGVTAAELGKLDAGAWFDPRFAGAKLPRLDEALALIRARGGVALVERKSGRAAGLARLLLDSGFGDEVVVQSYDWEFLRELHRLLPGLRLAALGPTARLGGRLLEDREKWLDLAWFDEIERTGATIVVWNRWLEPTAVEAAHARGLKVWVYGVEDAAGILSLRDMGVDGVITSDPARMREIVRPERVAP